MNRKRAELAIRGGRAFARAGVLAPMRPRTLRQVIRAGRDLQATPAASIAIAAARDPDGLAVADDYGERPGASSTAGPSAAAAALVQEFGAGPSRPVALMCRNHRGAIEVLAGAARAGADVLALNTEFADPQIAAALAGRDAAVIVHDDEFTPRVQAAALDLPAVCSLPDGGELTTPPPRRSQITILTSGTTGVPKAAARDIPAHAMLGAATTLIEHLGLRRGAPVLVAPPLFHGFGLGVTAIAHGIGAPVVIRRRFDPEETLALIERHRVQALVAVPVMLQRILALDPQTRNGYDRESLTAVLAGGAPLSPTVSERFMDAFGEILHNGYGSTETGFAAIAGPDDLRLAPGTVGRAPLGASIAILDEQRRPAPSGQTGHIFVGGDLVFDGYADGGSKELAAGLMNTGDLGYADAAGRIHVDGREDDMIVSGGENVFPQEVENALAAHPGVGEVAVVGVADEAWGQRLVAFVVPASAASTLTAEGLRAHLSDRLERYKLPRDVVFVPEIPRTPTGKVIRRELIGANG